MSSLQKTVPLAALLVIMGTGAASAAGFQISESSVTALGRAFSGAGIVGDDASAIAYNPAGMSLTQGSLMQAGATVINIRSKVQGISTRNVGGSVSGSTNPNITSVVPNAFFIHRYNDKINLGIGIFSDYGLSTEYANDWFGRNHALDSRLETLKINPSLSYKLTDNFTIGAGVNIQQISARLTQGLPVVPDPARYAMVKGDDWGYGYNFGLMYELNQDTRLGLSYRSVIRHQLEGQFYNPYGIKNIHANVDLPEYAILSGYHKFNDKFAFSGTVKWTHWDRFQELDIKEDGSNASVSYTSEKWKDTWYFGLGVDYFATDNLTLRAGWGYDNNPITSSEFRTARIPDNYRYLLSVGASYKFTESLTIDAGYMHIFLDNAKINNLYKAGAFEDRLTAVYKSEVNLFGLQMQYKF